MSITTALKARREAIADREAGFTLIELLVVVLIIGILAAIAIPVYLGVQNNAKDSAVKSDLTNNKTAISAYVSSSPSATLPANASTQASLTTLLKTYGFGVSSGATFGSYKVQNAGTSNAAFCLTEKSSANNWFVVTSNNAVTTATGDTCPAAY
jgi:prepilin-type N-terminal cleavage/methylation domain-containing protein